MPIVKATIEGREYSFAPLTIRHMRELSKQNAAPANVFEQIDLWKPYIEASMAAAGDEMPEFEDLSLEQGSVLLAQFIRCVVEASGVKMVPPGEGQPTKAATGTASSV